MDSAPPLVSCLDLVKPHDDLLRSENTPYNFIQEDDDGLLDVNVNSFHAVEALLNQITQDHVDSDLSNVDKGNLTDGMFLIGIFTMADKLFDTCPAIRKNELGAYNRDGDSLGLHNLEILKNPAWYDDKTKAWGEIYLMARSKLLKPVAEAVERIADLGHPEAQLSALRMNWHLAIQAGTDKAKNAFLDKAIHYAEKLGANPHTHKFEQLKVYSDDPELIDMIIQNLEDERTAKPFNPLAAAPSEAEGLHM